MELCEVLNAHIGRRLVDARPEDEQSQDKDPAPNRPSLQEHPTETTQLAEIKHAKTTVTTRPATHTPKHQTQTGHAPAPRCNM
jgi:hypothetical protein